MSAADRKSATKWFIGSVLLALPAGYLVMQDPPPNRVFFLILLTQVPFLFAVPLLVDSMYKWGRRAQVVEPPRFEQADGRRGAIRFNPTGGASVALRIAVINPNPFRVTLHTLATTMLFEGHRVAAGDFRPGLSLTPWQEEVFSIDLSIGPADMTLVTGPLLQAAIGQGAIYRLEGTVGVDAGRLGQHTFGPRLLMLGSLYRQPAER